MIVLTGNASGPKFSQLIGDRKNIGQLLSPVGWRVPSRRYWACDNDVFAHRSDTHWWHKTGETAWLKMLDKAALQKSDPLWVLLPDVVADWKQTLERAYHYLPEIQQRELPVALALQDGCNFTEALHVRPDCVFVGGSTGWKWQNVEAICRYFQPRRIKVHVGRVSGPLRVRECLRVGADSCDGTGWTRHSIDRLPELWRELDGNHAQLRLSL